MPVHVIRLRGPWKLQIDDCNPTGITLPNDDWLSLAGQFSVAKLARHFHRPTGIDGQHVFLVISISPLPATVRLNGSQLVVISDGKVSQRLNITKRLASRNHLLIEFDGSTIDSELPGVCNIQLEIE